MKILYSHYLTDDDHPAARMVHVIAEELRTLGHTVEVHRSAGPVKSTNTVGSPAANSANPTERKRNAKLKSSLWFAKAISRNRKMYYRDRDAIKRFRPDIVLCRQDAYCISMPAACRKSNVPMVTYADAPVAYEARHFDFTGRWHPTGVVERMERWGLSHSKGIITVSQPAAAILGDYKLGVPVSVIPNGVDLKRFQPVSRAEKNQLRQTLDIQTPHVAGFIGSFRPFHGLDILSNLIRNTRNRSDLTWILVGDGPGLPQLKEAAGDDPRVKFLGKRPSSEIPKLLSLMDVMVAPQKRTDAKFYFCPLKILEGMAAGLPILASDQGDIPFMVEQGVSGHLVSSDDPIAWTKSLKALLDSPFWRRFLGDASLRKAQKYSWRETALRVERVLLGISKRTVTKPVQRYSVCDKRLLLSTAS